MKESSSLLIKKAKLLGDLDTYHKIINKKAEKQLKNYPHKPISRCFNVQETTA